MIAPAPAPITDDPQALVQRVEDLLQQIRDASSEAEVRRLGEELTAVLDALEALPDADVRTAGESDPTPQ